MRAFSNMPNGEFIAQLRDIAINAKARPAVIDAIDALRDEYEQSGDLEEADQKLADMEEQRNHYRDALCRLVDALQGQRDLSEKAADALEFAKNVADEDE